MARERGIFQVSANYEPLKAAPFDARMLVETKADLTAEATWVTNGVPWIYNGMMVVVSRDIEDSNNGVYILKDALNYTDIASWQKLANADQIANLQEQIDNIKVSGGGSLDLNLDTEADLPEVGDINTTYYIKENTSIQRWDADTESYISFGGGDADLDIEIIYGGDSNNG